MFVSMPNKIKSTDQISDQQGGISGISQVEDQVIEELKSLSSNVAIDLSPVESTTHLTDISKPTQTNIDMSTGISDDGGLIQVL